MLEWLLNLFYYLLFKWHQFFNKKHNDLDIYEVSDQPDDYESKRELLNKQKESIIFQGSSNDTSVFIEVRLSEQWVTANLLFLIEGKKFILPNGSLKRPRRLSNDSFLNIGPLRIELREAFRRWRITFRGDLEDEQNRLRFVHWESWWAPLLDAYWFMQEIPIDLLAKCAAETNDSGLYTRLQNNEDFFQWGMFRSRISVDENEPLEFDLRGFRIRTIQSDVNLERLTTSFMLNAERNVRFEATLPNYLKPLEFGLKFKGNGFVEPLDCSVDEDVEHIALHSLKINSFSTSNLEISRLIHKQGSGFTWFLETHKDSETQEELAPIEYGYKANELDRKFSVLPFTHRACMDSNLCGGKGSNLARLTGLQHKFLVPRGLVVTATAFQRYLKENLDLQLFLKSLENESIEDFEVIEKKVKDLFNQTKLDEKLKTEIYDQLQQIFDDHLQHVKFAVRSSAVGEDGAEFSSAGQLESYLHVDLEDISSKIIECWASNFRREVMSYRFENGQNLIAPMAVVIQEMIVEGIAGVMFTNDPVKGDPSKIVLNLVEGDGEALVSGQANPTQIIVSKRNLQILNKSGKELLTDKQCLELAKLGSYIEHSFEHPQDIEFVFKSGRIHVVQSRHITNLDIESDWALKHEFDSALLTPHCVMTTANVGEVFSTPVNALDSTTTSINYDRVVKLTFNYMAYKPTKMSKHYSSAILIHRQRVFLEMVEAMLRNWESIEKDRIPEYNIAGSKVFTEETIKFGPERFPPKSSMQKLYEIYKLGKIILMDSWHYNKKIGPILDEMKLFTIPNKLSDILSTIKTQRRYFIDILDCHTKITLFANITYAVLSIILRGSPEGEISPELLSNIAAVYSNNSQDVISGDVPFSLKKLAKTIKANEKIRNEFQSFSSAKEAVDYLKKDQSKCGELFREFLTKHGHRGLSELMFSGVPWCRDHEHLVATLNLMIEDQNLESSTEKEVISNVDNLIASLNGDFGNGQKRGLKFFIPHTHRGVAFRESAKNILVYATFLMRNTYWHLAKQMHKQKLINRPELMFHMTFGEISQLIQNPNPQIVARARRRQKIYDSQAEQNYPSFSVGAPIPLNDTFVHNESGDFKVYGTTVCEGKVIGRARVVKSLAEARETKHGEILITKCTDIAWSPLFPILKGLVTEIGGLLSHGAVVAREYSLPCVIAVENATNIFKTGDKILLNATKGEIERLADD